MERAAAEGNPEHRRSLTLRLAHGAGGHRHFDVVAANRLHDPSVEGFVLNMRDATDRRELEDVGFSPTAVLPTAASL